MTKIPWTEKTWNPVTGCTKVSPGCANCYAERMARRLAGRCGYPEAPNHFDVTLRPDRLEQPQKWKKPRQVFVGSMTDLFHKNVPDDFIHRVIAAIAQCPQHAFQLLTKRAERMKMSLRNYYLHDDLLLDNLWAGVTAEDQQRADERISQVIQTPAVTRFASLEPLLGPISLDRNVTPDPHPITGQTLTFSWLDCWGIDWVIIGCESGPQRRPCKLEWVRDLVQQCQAARVAVFVKQLDIDGRVSKDPAEWPEDLRVREYPK